MTRSVAELKRRRLAGRFGLFDGLVAWARPTLAAAAALAALSLLALARLDHAAAEVTPALFRAASLPAPLEAWLIGDEQPATFDQFTLEGESR